MGYKLIKVYLYSIILLILGFVISLTSYFSTRSASADSSGVESVTISLPISCTISGSNNTHSETLVNNTYDSNIGGTDQSPNSNILTTYCNDKDGYIIYAIGASNSEEGNTNLIGDNGNNINTGVYTSGDTASSWSFKLTNLDNILTIPPSYADFHTIPDEWTEIAKKPSGTVDSTTGAKFSTTYAAYISGTQAAGTYTGQVKYAMLHPSSSTQPTTLAQAYKNAGKSKVYTTDPITGDSGYFYTMQDMTSAICNNTNVYGEASQTQLVDIRDGKLYWATKLHTDKDNPNIGQCWMTENLDLDLISDTQAEGYVALTSENTDLNLYGSMGYTSANGYSCENSEAADCSGGTIKWVPIRSTIAPDNLSSATWPTNNTSPYSYDSGAITPDGYKNGHGYSGNYYNWPATIASNAPGSYSGSINAANSICPAGWRPPNAMPEEKGYEFSKLLYAYEITTDDKNTDSYTTDGFNRIISEPLYFLKSGYIYGGTLSSLATVGTYWYSTSSSSLGGNFLYFNKNHIGVTYYQSLVGNGGSKRYGFSVRCLAK